MSRGRNKGDDEDRKSSTPMKTPRMRQMNADDISKRSSQGKSNIPGGWRSGGKRKKDCGGTGTGA